MCRCGGRCCIAPIPDPGPRARRHRARPLRHGQIVGDPSGRRVRRSDLGGGCMFGSAVAVPTWPQPRQRPRLPVTAATRPKERTRPLRSGELGAASNARHWPRASVSRCPAGRRACAAVPDDGSCSQPLIGALVALHGLPQETDASCGVANAAACPLDIGDELGGRSAPEGRRGALLRGRVPSVFSVLLPARTSPKALRAIEL